jgi:hypothetical protein
MNKQIYSMIIVLLLLSPIAMAKSLDYIIYNADSRPHYSLMGNATIDGPNSTQLILQYNHTLVKPYTIFVNEIDSNSISAFRVEFQCSKSINEYNYQNPTTKITNIRLTIQHKTMYSDDVSELDYYEIPSNTITQSTKGYTYLLNEKSEIFVRYYIDFENTPNFESSPCNLIFYNPSETGDSVDITGKSLFQIEQEQADSQSEINTNMLNAMYKLVGALFECLLILYWVIKIMLTLFVISTILWIFIWFYKLIKKLLGEL